MFDNDRLVYSVTEACNVMGIGKTYLYELIGSGKIDARKLGKKTLIMAESLRSYIASLPASDIGKKPK